MDTSINPLPTLSVKGYIYDLEDRCDRMMSYFLSSQESESYLYQGRVISLEGLVQRYGGDPQNFCTQIKMALTEFFGYAFAEGVVADARHDATRGVNDTARYNVWISVEITEKGKSYSLNEQILKKDSSFQRVVNAVNDGNFD
jgi:hypothetical protein